MSYGALFTGLAGQIIIDDTNPVYSVVYSGTYNDVGNTGVATINFPSPINSQAWPLVMFKPDGAHMVRNFKILGSPGAWTGFSYFLYSDAGFSNVVRSGVWKVAAIWLPATGDWGLRVRDSYSRIVFDSNREPISLVAGGQSWLDGGRNPSYLGQWTTQTFIRSWVKGNYFVINPYSGGYAEWDMASGFLDGGSNTASNFCMFLMKAGVGQPGISADGCHYPLIIVK
ncbi:hypothetical protein [Pseudomonas delhiensis]|uniref:hypothetical protein n=1 Tax=Pseudomonas delhiensis TaxID=366289 RepID=UPI0031599AC1